MYVCACVYGHAIHKHCFQQTSKTMPVFFLGLATAY